jgi:hypothetical protein
MPKERKGINDRRGFGVPGPAKIKKLIPIGASAFSGILYLEKGGTIPCAKASNYVSYCDIF